VRVIPPSGHCTENNVDDHSAALDEPNAREECEGLT
jgi:hypothetical protein